MGQVTALATPGGSILLGACIGLLLALGLLLVVVSIVFGGNRRRDASGQGHRARVDEQPTGARP